MWKLNEWLLYPFDAGLFLDALRHKCCRVNCKVTRCNEYEVLKPDLFTQIHLQCRKKLDCVVKRSRVHNFGMTTTNSIYHLYKHLQQICNDPFEFKTFSILMLQAMPDTPRRGFLSDPAKWRQSGSLAEFLAIWDVMWGITTNRKMTDKGEAALNCFSVMLACLNKGIII